MENNMQGEPITIELLVNNVRNGNFPDVPRSNDERITVMPESLLSNYAIIMAQCILNSIPEENAQEIYPKRAELYDNLMLIVNTGNLGRTNRLVAAIEKLFEESKADTVCWPSKKLANNIGLFAAEFFAWNDYSRAVFLNGNRELVAAPQETVVESDEDVITE